MAATLTVAIDDWVSAHSLPVRHEFLNDLPSLAARRDYSTLPVEDAFPLLYQTCETIFGNLEPLYFDIKILDWPLAYSATLTVTGSDEIGIEFPNSGRHASPTVAKMHAAHKAIQQGAIAFMMQGQTWSSPDIPATGSSSGLKGAPLSSSIPKPKPSGPPSAPKGFSQSIPVHTGPVLPNIPIKPVMPHKPTSAKPNPSSKKSPVSIINELLQKVYSVHKLHKQANSALKWEHRKYPEGHLARMTVTLPSGDTKSYGSIPDHYSVNLKSQYLKLESAPNLAKRVVAAYAIQLGVLDYIITENVSGRALASVVAPSKAAVLPPRPPSATGPNGIPLEKSPAQGPSPPREDVHDRSSMSMSSSDDVQLPSAPQANGAVQDNSRINTSPNAQWAVKPSELPASPKIRNETFDASIESSHPTRERLGSYEPLGDDEQSEAMSIDLDTDADAGTRGESAGPDTDAAPKDPLETEENRPQDEEPPKKRQKTEPIHGVETGTTPGATNAMEVTEPMEACDAMLAADVEAASEESKEVKEVKEAKDMQGTPFVEMLSAYCIENGHPQPQVTYQRQFDKSNPNAPVLYNLSLIIGAKRYELSKHYENIQSAEEKLSKRILKLFGVKAKKV